MREWNKYQDIIHLPRHVSNTHAHMPVEDRAAQFAPFAALTGHHEAVKEAARLTDKRMELDEYCKEVINGDLLAIKAFSNKGKDGDKTESFSHLFCAGYPERRRSLCDGDRICEEGG